MSTIDRKEDTAYTSSFDCEDKRFVVLYAEWNQKVTHALRDGCVETLLQNGIPDNHIAVIPVPGSFELSTAAAFYAEDESVDAVICLGCVIQGETRHFDFICNAVANGLTQVGIDTQKPVIFGVLTTNTQQQAEERSGGSLGNKGSEAALAALQMLEMQQIPLRTRWKKE